VQGNLCRSAAHAERTVFALELATLDFQAGAYGKDLENGLFGQLRNTLRVGACDVADDSTLRVETRQPQVTLALEDTFHRPDGTLSVLADSYRGKRLNSPNDLAYKSDGSLYFTDPPFGLPKFFDDPRKELPFSGVYRWKEREVTLLAQELSGPNGIAFSPDERHLYVGNWDEQRKVVMRYTLNADGTLGQGEVFFDMTSAPGEDAIDGVKVDVEGNVYVSGPGGLRILSPQGKHLGTIRPPRHPHNMAWGDAEGRTLYITAQDRVYRMRLNIPGVRPQAAGISSCARRRTLR
jgi:sugar lactone lactonase YvrE